MKSFRILYLALLLCVYSEMHAQEQIIPVLGFTEFEKYLHRDTDSVYIVNFWATWCGPCRKELPDLEKIHSAYTDEKVKVILVSLDFPAQLKKVLVPFIKNNRITASVILLNEPDANAWIDKVNPEWTGSIPATLIYTRNNRLFYEKELSFQELDNSIHSLINP